MATVKVKDILKKIWIAWRDFDSDEWNRQYEEQCERDREALRRWDYQDRMREIDEKHTELEERRREIKRNFGY